jgi:cytochrome c553
MIRAILRTLLIGGAIASALVRAVRHPGPPIARVHRSWWKRFVKPRLLEYSVLFAILGVLGFLVAASGIIPIRASSGHWAITRWFLEFAKTRSVATHSIGVKPPPLGDRQLVIKGAGAYDLTCRPCHGSPDLRDPRVARAMLPRPPYLASVIEKRSPAELFYIINHGLKFTGMPAWPARHRGDEVWSVVAFLLELPKLDAAEYQSLVRGESATPPMQSLAGLPPAIMETCARCHGFDGRGRGVSAFPSLAGQRRTYLFNALQAYSAGRRHSGFMEPVAAALTTRQMHEIALYFSALDLRPVPIGRNHESAIARGMIIASRGIPAQDVPACADCHGPSASRKNDAYPILAGQYADYLVLQLELFKSGHRGGSKYAHLMRPVAAGLTREQMRDVALFYESLGSR